MGGPIQTLTAKNTKYGFGRRLKAPDEAGMSPTISKQG